MKNIKYILHVILFACILPSLHAQYGQPFATATVQLDGDGLYPSQTYNINADGTAVGGDASIQVKVPYSDAYNKSHTQWFKLKGLQFAYDVNEPDPNVPMTQGYILPIPLAYSYGVTRTINSTGVIINTDGMSYVSYSVSVTLNLTLLINSSSATVQLQTSTDNTTWTTIDRFSVSSGGTLVLSNTVIDSIAGFVPANNYVRINVATTNATATYSLGTENKFKW